MQSEFHFNREESIITMTRRWLRPTGGSVSDGLRLAVANGLFIVVALIFSFLLAVVVRVLRFVFPLPSVNPGLVVLGLSILFAAIVWYRYGSTHRNLAQASGRMTNPDQFGLIAGLPFALLALLLLGSGLFGLLVSVAGLSIGGATGAAGRLLYAVLFGLLAVGSVVTARVSIRD
jgi:hypothetical protein